MELAPKTLYSRLEAAGALSISLRSLGYLIASGEIRVIRKGRRVMVHRTEIERWAKIDNPRPMRQASKLPVQRDSAQMRLA